MTETQTYTDKNNVEWLIEEGYLRIKGKAKDIRKTCSQEPQNA